MNKTWIIFRHEYARHVFRWRFIVALFSLPAMFLLMFILALVAFSMKYNRGPVGYIDQAQVIKVHTLPVEGSISFLKVRFLPYPGEAEARAALEKKEIQAYFILPPDYRKSHQARLVYIKKPNNNVLGQFVNFLRYNLLAGQPSALTRRVINGPTIFIQATKEKQAEKQQGADSRLFRAIVPVAISYMLFGSVVSTTGYLTQAVVEEKENRTMEILATSTSPGSIMIGKILALASVGLTQFLVWCSPPLVALIFLAPLVPSLQNTVRLDSLLLIFVTGLSTFLLISTLTAMIGVTLSDEREGQGIAMLVMLPAMLPYLLANNFISNPSGPVAIILSFFPLTAAVTLLFRLAFSTVPTWQIIASTGLLLLSTVAALWFAGRVFRIWMLRYRKPLNWKEKLRAVLKIHRRKETARNE